MQFFMSGSFMILMPLLGFIPISAASISKSSKTSSVTSSTSSFPVQSATPYYIPFNGPGPFSNITWGIDIEDQNNKFEIVITNDTNPISPWKGCDDSSLAITDAMLNGAAANLKLPPNNGTSCASCLDSLVLGLNSTLQISDEGGCNDFKVVDTVPFGLNLGNFSTYNGSVTFGGYYDSNRIASTNWVLIEESEPKSGRWLGFQNGSFLKTGRLEEVFIKTISPMRLNESFSEVATLSMTDDTLHLAVGVCGFDNIFVFTESNGKSISITIPADLTANSLDGPIENKKCFDTNDYDIAQTVLGLPFFQAAYAYVDTSGQIFLAAANDYDLEVSPVQFDANATLTIPEKPASTSKSSATAAKKVQGWSVALLGLVIFGVSL